MLKPLLQVINTHELPQEWVQATLSHYTSLNLFEVYLPENNEVAKHAFDTLEPNRWIFVVHAGDWHIPPMPWLEFLTNLESNAYHRVDACLVLRSSDDPKAIEMRMEIQNKSQPAMNDLFPNASLIKNGMIPFGFKRQSQEGNAKDNQVCENMNWMQTFSHRFQLGANSWKGAPSVLEFRIGNPKKSNETPTKAPSALRRTVCSSDKLGSDDKSCTHPFRVAVVTPVSPSHTKECMRAISSAQAQTFTCTHFLVFDGCAAMQKDLLEVKNVKIFSLPTMHNDFGATPRAIGAISAWTLGFDALAFLDSDNTFEPHHIETLVELHKETKASIVTCNRLMTDDLGNILGTCPDSDGKQFVDTNCMLLTRRAFPLLRYWFEVDPSLKAVGDRVFWFEAKRAGLKTIHTSQASVYYSISYRFHYQRYARIPPPHAKWPREISMAMSALKAYQTKRRET